ncbi:MAG: hypothetical protein U5L09_02875 [Bacteroidales bacterium]|nr:hypothetical protein [Bacteroidales bacterium]
MMQRKNINGLMKLRCLKPGSVIISNTAIMRFCFSICNSLGIKTGITPTRVTCLNEENIYPNSPNSIYYQSGNSEPNSNAYESNVQNFGFYVSNEFKPLPGLKAILGLRAENYVQRHTGRDWRMPAVIRLPVLTSTMKRFWSRSTCSYRQTLFMHSMKRKTSRNRTYSRTIARQNLLLRNFLFAQISDPITNRIFNGSLFTYSDWTGSWNPLTLIILIFAGELFLDNGQMYSVSAFYKAFDKRD